MRSWTISVLLHLLLLLLFAFALRSTPKGIVEAATREVGIVLNFRDADGSEQFAGEPSAPSSEDQSTRESQADRPSLAELLSTAPPVDPTLALPAVRDWIGTTRGAAAPDASQMTQGRPTTGKMADGRARTSIFGIPGEGYKFVYVFDRSGSMGGSTRSPLNAAKAQLLASLENLGETHQFQIIFYNEKPAAFHPDGRSWNLLFATPQNREEARRFVKGIIADGATDHELALLMALNLQSDVIFFLTDADQPPLSRSQLDRIAEKNSGRTVIHTIEFGLGPSIGEENFLVKIARQNGGEYRYIDVSEWDREQ